MAKRKRLTPAQPGYLAAETPVLETKSMGFTPGAAPVAQVAGDAAATAALVELADEVKAARDEGRMIQALPEKDIDAHYLVRDRMLADEPELQALMESLRARGQQTPIEVVQLEQGRYGLISGWRRLTALRRLLAETGEDRFAHVQAILRRPETAADAYVAMVEENEIRVGLSYYERARVAAKAVEQGVYDSEKQALLHLFSTASRARRSKIRSFLALYHAADDLLRFPTAIGERLGLTLAKQLQGPAEADLLRALLQADPRPEAAAELRCLENFAEGETPGARPGEAEPIVAKSANPGSVSGQNPEKGRGLAKGFDRPVDGIRLDYNGHRLTLSGPGVDADLRRRLLDWLKTGG